MAAVDLVLVAGAALMGLAGVAHCAAMCGGLSASVIGRCGGARDGRAALSFHAGRILAYSAGGAVAAASVGLLREWSAFSPALRPLWTLAQAGALALGLWLLWTGRQPAWMSTGAGPALPAPLAADGWRPMAGPVRAGAAGAAWVAWPCGLLQSALVTSTQASSAAMGALTMAVFAIVSSAGLWGAQRVLGRVDTAWAVRLAGAVLVGAAGWALGHGLWQRIAAFC